MGKYIIKRVLKALLTIWLVYTFVFCMTRLTGDPVEWVLDEDAEEATKQALREQYGLDKPLYEQYVSTVVDMFRGDAGTSYYYKQPVTQLFSERIGVTLKINGLVLILSFLLGVPIGILCALRPESKLDKSVRTLTVLGHTTPNFVIAILLIFVFSLWLHLLPSGELKSWLSWIMPVTTLTIGHLSQIVRQTRGSMLDVLHEDYLDTARAKGVHESIVIFKHGLRNALIPVVTVFGNMLGHIVGGAVIIENVFALPGVGFLIVNGAKHRDFPLVQFGVLVIACVVTVVNILVDISYSFLNPRLRDN